ncbi:MAG TPA: hypothetical protein VHY20_13965 [Pirellulales bacterium]|nr:hypothetical protein [Pirellulales bacterium]
MLHRQLIRLIGHLADAPGILLALHSAEGLGGVAEAIGGVPSIGGALLLRSGSAQRVSRCAQRIDSALDARVGRILRLALGGLSLRLALSRLAGLSGLAARLVGRRLAGRRLTGRRPILLLVLRQLLKLLLQLLRVAAKHFFLPALLETLAIGALLIYEILLALRERVELA